MDETLVDAGKTLALFFLGALVVDRLAKNLRLALELLPAWGTRFPGELAEKAGKLAYFVIALIIGIAMAAMVKQMRILEVVPLIPVKDGLFTGLVAALVNGLVLMGGADLVQTLLGYLEDRREIGVPGSAESVQIDIINKHEGPVEVQSGGKVVEGQTVARLTEKDH